MPFSYAHANGTRLPFVIQASRVWIVNDEPCVNPLFDPTGINPFANMLQRQGRTVSAREI